MVDELTQQSFSTSKAVVEVATELIKLLAVEINKEARKIENSLSKQKVENEIYTPMGGWLKSGDLNAVKMSNKEVADTFENKLKERGFKYDRLSDDKFVVAAKNKNLVSNVVRQSAKEIAKEQFQNREMANSLMEKRLQEAGVDYKRVGNEHFSFPEKDKEKVKNIAQNVKKEVKEKRNGKKESFRDRIQKNKQKAAKKDKQKFRHKQKSLNRNR